MNRFEVGSQICISNKLTSDANTENWGLGAGEEQKWRKTHRKIGRARIIRNPGAQGETSHSLDSNNPLTHVKPPSGVTIFVFSEVTIGAGVQ